MRVVSEQRVEDKFVYSLRLAVKTYAWIEVSRTALYQHDKGVRVRRPDA
jgi:hypothetical protein